MPPTFEAARLEQQKALAALRYRTACTGKMLALREVLFTPSLQNLQPPYLLGKCCDFVQSSLLDLVEQRTATKASSRNCPPPNSQRRSLLFQGCTREQPCSCILLPVLPAF